MPDDAVVIDLSGMRRVSVDPTQRTATAMGGCLLLDLDIATDGARSARPPPGPSSTPALSGWRWVAASATSWAPRGSPATRSSARSWSRPRHMLEVDAEREPELLWGLRGGGGNFGVVTRSQVPADGGPVHVSAASSGTAGPASATCSRACSSSRPAAPDELVMQVVLARDRGHRRCRLTRTRSRSAATRRRAPRSSPRCVPPRA